MAPSPAPTLSDLQGTWRLTRVGKNGNKAPFFLMWLINLGLRVENNRYFILVKGEVIEEGTLTVTTRGDYSEFDQHVETGNDAGKMHLGLVRFVGKKLEHLQAEAGDPRPAGFPYSEKTRANMALMKRV